MLQSGQKYLPERSDRRKELPGQVLPALFVGLAFILLFAALVNGFFTGAAFGDRGR